MKSIRTNDQAMKSTRCIELDLKPIQPYVMNSKPSVAHPPWKVVKPQLVALRAFVDQAEGVMESSPGALETSGDPHRSMSGLHRH